MKRVKLITLSALLAAGAFLFQGGCLTAFWQGLTQGFPGGNRWLNLAVDVAHEAMFG